jgi:ribose-phosphate pyrophosphokinase
LRQDAHFQPGEALSARHFASLISAHFDGIATVDPHLHRIKQLGEVYSIPARVVSAAPLLGRWIGDNVAKPFLIGPDSESGQWVASAAAAANVSYCVLAKRRRGDESVDLAWPELSGLAGKTPVLLDDIAASGATLIAAAKELSARGFAKPICVIVHALLHETAYAELQRVCARVVSTDAVSHPSNAIPIASALAH